MTPIAGSGMGRQGHCLWEGVFAQLYGEQFGGIYQNFNAHIL